MKEIVHRVKITALIIFLTLLSLTACAPKVPFTENSTPSLGVENVSPSSPVSTPGYSVKPTPEDVTPVEVISSLEDLALLDDVISAQSIHSFEEYVVEYKIRYHSDDFEVVGYISAPLDYLEHDYPVLIF